MLKFARTSLIAAALLTTSVVASDILVTVNGKNITKQDAEAFVSATAPNAHYEQLSPQQKALVKKTLVEKALLSDLAKKEGIDKTPEFKKNLEKIANELMVNMWMKKQMDSAVVSDSEAKDFYEKNKAKFLMPETVHARHILVKSEKEAKQIISELKGLKGDALKQKFISLAKSKSIGPSKSKGGDLGTFKKGQMVPAFSQAVWSLKPGEVTKTPVKTQFGYHVIYLEAKNPAQAVSYDKVKDKIIATLKQQEFAKKVSEVVSELRSKAKIVDMEKETAKSAK